MPVPTRGRRLNLGCGRRWVAGWDNVDGGPLAKRLWLRAIGLVRRIRPLERILPAKLLQYPSDVIVWDLRRTPLPFPDGSAEVMFSQYVLEYLTVEDTRRLLRDCRRVLGPGGIIRLCQTDIRAGIRQYLAESDLEPSPEALVRTRDLHERLNGEHTKLSVRLLHGGGHQQLFDAPSLEWLLREAGFDDVRIVAKGEGRCPSLESLEADFAPVPMIRMEGMVPA